ncbi:hypothetical protein LTR08_005703 [Meristemomyces frigidus]|nr:hypothetical protein LTR08_005703 [Meristemomyces frigidus]
MDSSTKRKASGDGAGNDDKRNKTKRQWQVPRKNNHGAVGSKVIQPGDSGIWATCNKGREAKCVGELRDLFTEYAELLYGDALAGDADGDDAEGEPADIESEIQAEVAGIRKPSTVQLFTPVRLDVQCVVFFRTAAPVEPVSFVKRICEDAMINAARKRTRCVKRLSPMTLMGRATTEGLEKVAEEVLAPHFRQDPFQPRKFAIRPTLRNHNILSRDSIIKQIAPLVGKGHEVDLKNYDLLIIVEVYQNICGVSVVDDSFERLKRFNLAEIFDPTPKQDARKVDDSNDDISVSKESGKSPSETTAAVEPTPSSMELS